MSEQKRAFTVTTVTHRLRLPLRFRARFWLAELRWRWRTRKYRELAEQMRHQIVVDMERAVFFGPAPPATDSEGRTDAKE